MAPPGVSIHAARVSAKAPWATWTDDGRDVVLAPDMAHGAAQLASLAPSAVVVAHTSSSIVGGPGWDHAVTAKLVEILPENCAITTNGVDCIGALSASGVSAPFVVFPPWFGDAINARGLEYLAALGVRASGHIRQIPAKKWQHLRPEELYGALMHVEQRTDMLFDQIVQACPAEADGVLIVGTGVRCVGIIAALETALGRPVVTANQASLWRCLGLSGVDAAISGYGTLFAKSRVPADPR